MADESEGMTADEKPKKRFGNVRSGIVKGFSCVRKKFAKGGTGTLALLFVLGFFFGVAAKTVASRSILIGYGDYTISPKDRSAVDINAIQAKLGAQQDSAAAASDSGSGTANGGSANGDKQGSDADAPVPSGTVEQ